MTNISGKLVIIGIVTVALVAAGTSWWFRYNATRQSAEFWGPEKSRLIRDAPVVEFWRHDPPPDSTFLASEFSGTYAIVDPADIRDVATAHGLVHLRNALLDDRSYNWPRRRPKPDTRWEWGLNFRSDAGKGGAILLFSSDGKFVATFDRPNEVLSCEPIADGLTEMFAEFAADADPAR